MDENKLGTTSMQWASDVVPAVLERVRERRRQRQEAGGEHGGLSTGLASLDARLDGLGAPLTLLAGPPGAGKTSLAWQLATHVAAEVPVVYCTFESSPASLIMKALATTAGVDLTEVTRGYVDPVELSEAAEEMGTMWRRLALLDGPSRLTVGQLRDRARQAMSTHGSSRCLIVVDYLQVWGKASREFRDLPSVRERVEVLGVRLRELALELGSPVLAVASQNRSGGDYGGGGGRAALDSLKESGDLEYSADVLMFLTASKDGKVAPPAKALDLTIAKHREGETGVVRLIFRPDRGTLREA